jgi:hypothetical protein
MKKFNHKVRITAEAQFDYEYCICKVMRDIPDWREVMIRIDPIKAILYSAKTELALRRLRSARLAERRYRGTDTDILNGLFTDIAVTAEKYGKELSNPEYADLRAAAFLEYDKYDAPFRAMHKRHITAYAEDYINGLAEKADLENLYYLRVQYFDESLDEWLLLFFKRDEVSGETQYWKLFGLCEDDAFDEALWENGGFRSIFAPFKTDCGDWVVDGRIEKMKHDREVEIRLNDRTTEGYMVKDLLKNYKKYRAGAAVGGKKELAVKLDLLDKCIANLWDDGQKCLIGHFINLGSLGKTAKKMCLSKNALNNRFNKTVAILEFLMAEAADK